MSEVFQFSFRNELFVGNASSVEKYKLRYTVMPSGVIPTKEAYLTA
jgi:hypothetical protein